MPHSILFFCLILVAIAFRSLAFVQSPKLWRERKHRDIHFFVSPTAAAPAKTATTSIDPLLTRLLLEQDESVLDFSSVIASSRGLEVWRNALLKGRLATNLDFQSTTTWPNEPLFTPLANAMAELQLPRFVLRHPESVSAVLLSLLRMASQYAKQSQSRIVTTEEVEEDEDEWDLLSQEWIDTEDLKVDQGADMLEEVFLSDEEKEKLAIDIVSAELTAQWGGVITGVHALDQIFGAGHGLVNFQDNDSIGFGLNDGVWQHSGWRLVPELHREISSMPEIKELISLLGRRPTAEQSEAMHKFVPRRLDEEGALGAQYDSSRRTSIRGITLSGSLSEMLPSEALLLAQKQEEHEKPTQSALRRLFLAKMVESKLLSYESAGWQDVPSSNVPKPRYFSRLPSAPGGPIMICLDTSWSMTGRREQLSKAVVLACVAAAHKHKRDVQVVAFSSASNTMETGPISADAHGVRRLLEFLSSSFGGGTDVTGALKHAMAVTTTEESPLNSTSVHQRDLNAMAAADILLVTDGEIPDPPVSEVVMQALDRLKQRAGVQVHGLLVGKRESAPLSKLCTHTHDFLIGYESVTPTAASAVDDWNTGSRTLLRSKRLANTPSHQLPAGTTNHARRFLSTRRLITDGRTSLEARYQDYYEDDDEDWGGQRKRRGRSYTRKSRYDQNVDLFIERDSLAEEASAQTISQASSSTPVSDFNVKADQVIQKLKDDVKKGVADDRWNVSMLDEEKSSIGSCWRYRKELQNAVDRVAEGLVERQEEARLVVLGMVSQEHVLFLGPPGTAKSVLGRRLSQLCGGTFFQRLLTRFTTPEEIFGPLSLRALENDEYRRKTDGFLPTASVAFLDEIFKANSAILNTLLTILNERTFDNGAGVRENCPIRCVVGASNELPESDELDALYDRFLLRKEVLPVSDEGVLQMLRMELPGGSPCDDPAEGGAETCETVFTDDLDTLVMDVSAAADHVVMDDDACTLMRELRTFMRNEFDVDVSDRRLVKSTRLLKISAACHGRTRVDPVDCLLLQHLVWRLPEQRAAVREWLWNHITPGSCDVSSTTIEDESLESSALSVVRQFRLLLDGLRQEAIALVRKTNGDVTGESGGRKSDIEAIQSLATESSRLGNILQQRSFQLARHSELLRRSSDHLWLDPVEAQAAQQLLLPRANAYAKEVERALQDALSLEKALSDNTVIPNDCRLVVVEQLWDENGDMEMAFSEDALSMSMKEAKKKYDTETFRKWKRARKKANKS